MLMVEKNADDRGKLVLEFKNSYGTFEIFEAPVPVDGYPYVGYRNGKKSVLGDRADVVARGLARKHVEGLPEGKLIQFPVKDGS